MLDNFDQQYMVFQKINRFNGVPTVTFNKSTEMIDKTIKEFDAVVEKIQHKDFSGRAKDKNLCANCDMRHYCRRKGDC